MKKLSFDTYDVLITENFKELDLSSYLEEIIEKKSKILVITDKNIHNIYYTLLEEELKDYNVIKYILEPGENSKSIDTYLKLTEFCIENDLNKNDLVISFGGGVVSDITGFFSSTYKRGVKFISIPTSLIGQIDASIGGKVGLNYKGYKNQIGCFYDPLYVFISLDFLNTLPKEELDSGYGELIKIALVGDNKLLQALQDKDFNINEKIIYRAIDVKKQYVLKDYYDLNERHVLNLGHTVAHAIESLSKYKVPHGIAVIIGIYKAIEIGEKLQITNENIKNIIDDILENLSIKLPQIDYQNAMAYIKKDKKVEKEGIKIVSLEDITKPVIIKVLWENIDELFS